MVKGTENCQNWVVGKRVPRCSEGAARVGGLPCVRCGRAYQGCEPAAS